MTEYNPWSDARNRHDIIVGVTPLIDEQGWWLPADRVILISELQPAGVVRSAALAHQLAHVDLEGSFVVESAREGVANPSDIEAAARRLTSRRFLSLADIYDGIADTATLDGHELAAHLGVTPVVLADRIRYADDDEGAAIADVARLVEWTDTVVERWACGQHLRPLSDPHVKARSMLMVA